MNKITSDVYGKHTIKRLNKLRSQQVSRQLGKEYRWFNFFKIIAVITLGVMGCNSAVYSAGLAPPPPLPMYDRAGVDLSSGYPTISQADLSIGNGVSQLPHTISSYNNMFWGFYDDYTVEAVPVVVAPREFMRITVGKQTQLFKYVSGNISTIGVFSPVNSDGATLVQLTTNGNSFKYVMRDGTVVMIGGAVETITYPNGFTVKLYKRSGRIQSVLTNTGLQLKYNYRSNVALPASYTNDEYSQFMHPSSIAAINTAFEFCDPSADTCALTLAWPTVKYYWPTFASLYPPTSSAGPATGVFKVVDPMELETTYVHNSYTTNIMGGWPYEPRISSIVGPKGSTTFDFKNLSVCEQVQYITLEQTCHVAYENVVVSAKLGGVECTYGYVLPATPYVGLVVTSNCPNDSSSLLKDNYGVGGPLRLSGRSGEIVFVQNDTRRASSSTYQGKQISYTAYDERGNLTQELQTARAGSVEAATVLTSSAGYPEPGASNCVSTSLMWCNKPKWVKDARQHQTDYQYYDEHGQIKSVTLPADKNGIRPQTRYKYSQLYAWYKNASSAYVQADSPVWMLTEENTCSEGNALAEGCAIPDKLVVTRYYYGPNSGPNNLWLRGVERIADGKTLRTCYQYDKFGHVIAETAPKAGLSSCQ